MAHVLVGALRDVVSYIKSVCTEQQKERDSGDSGHPRVQPPRFRITLECDTTHTFAWIQPSLRWVVCDPRSGILNHALCSISDADNCKRSHLRTSTPVATSH